MSAIRQHYYTDIGNASHGHSASLVLSHNIRFGTKFRLTPSVSVVWLSDRLVDYYYGVRPIEATSIRPAYAGSDTVNGGAGLNGAYRIARTWSLLGGLHAVRLGSGIVDSPIVSRRWSSLAYLGAGWSF